MLRRLVLRSSAVAARVTGGSLAPAATRAILPLSIHGDGLLVAPNHQIQMFCRHFLDIFQIGNKAAMEKERVRLSDELNRGYFADIKEFNQHGGKISVANKTIIPSVVAVKFPDLEVNFSNGTSLKLPICPKQSEVPVEMVVPSVSLLCISFRASSQEKYLGYLTSPQTSNSKAMTESWSRPFVDTFGTSREAQIFEISFVDSWFLSLSPVKQLMLRMMKKSSCPSKQTVYSFGDHYYFRKKLNILNLLTGYVFLLDKFGKIRWQGSGFALQEEVSWLLSCTSLLLDEK